MSLSAAQGSTVPTGYASHWYWTDQLQTHGRYVCLAVWGEPFIITDEIEVYAGEPQWVNEPLTGPVVDTADAQALARHLAIQAGIRKRLVQDIQSLRTAAEVESVPAQTQRKVLDGLVDVEANLEQACRDYEGDFRTVLPLNSWHERLMRTQAWLWRAQGLEPLTCWSSNLWDPLPLVGTPNRARELAVEVHLMRNEYRAAAFNVSNSGDAAAQVSFRLSGLPGGNNPEYVTVHEVAWTDTAQGVPVAAALPEIQAEKNQYTVEVPAGMTRQVWLTFHPVDVEPGTYEGEVIVTAVPGGQRFPLRMHLYPLDFPDKPSLHFGGWDYTHETTGFLAPTEQNRSLIIQHLRERFVDSPWGSPRLINPYYENVRGTYDATGAMTEAPDTTEFDAWIETWPGAAQYHIFVRVGAGFPGAPEQPFALDSPEFATAVRAWVTFWARHAEKQGIQPDQLTMCIVDEPDEEPDHDHIILAWANAIRAAGTGVRIWENPNHRDMNQALDEMIDACHVLCPHLGIFQNSSKPIRPDDAARAYRDYYARKLDQGIELCFYSAHGPSQIMDPYAYYRHMAWACWQYGATGMYLWSLTDAASASSWNEYLAKRNVYSPFFITKDSVTAGKHLEAAREGIEDYEYFVMLKRAVRETNARGASGPQLEEARRLLENLPASVYEAAIAGHPRWQDEDVDRTLADQARIKVLAALTALAEQ